jgi:hypothetical protein
MPNRNSNAMKIQYVATASQMHVLAFFDIVILTTYVRSHASMLFAKVSKKWNHFNLPDFNFWNKAKTRSWPSFNYQCLTVGANVTGKTLVGDQGCQIFLCTAYRNGGKYPNGHKIYPRCRKIIQMVIKYTNSIPWPFKIYPELGFWVCKYTIWQPCRRH